MKRCIISLCLLATFPVVKAQQPHTVVGYTPKSNTVTAMHFGYGNSLESITIAGKTLTTIKVSGNGQPKSISNEFATVDFSFAGTSNVNVTQTVNGETKTTKVPMNSEQVLQFRKDFASEKSSLGGLVDKADKLLENGGASLIGNIINTITDGLDNPINACFQQALDAAKNTKNPIIPIDCLEALVEVTKSHESAGDAIKGKAVDYIFDNYKEWRDGWSDLVYEGLKELDKKFQAENKKKQQDRLELAKKLLASGLSLDEAAKLIDDALNGNLPENSTSQEDKEDKEHSEDKDKDNFDYISKFENEYTICEGYIPIETHQDAINYITMKCQQLNRRLPNLVHFKYKRRYAPMANRSFSLFLNPDKKTYEAKEYSKDNPDAIEREDPYIEIIVDGPPDWAVGCCWNQNIVIPLKKISND